MFSLKDAAIQGPVEAQWLFNFSRCRCWCREQLLADMRKPRVKGEGVFHLIWVRWLIKVGFFFAHRCERVVVAQFQKTLLHSAVLVRLFAGCELLAQVVVSAFLKGHWASVVTDRVLGLRLVDVAAEEAVNDALLGEEVELGLGFHLV